MFDLLKDLALDKLKEKMLPNALGAEATQAAAEQGSSDLISSLVDQVKSGDLSTITSLFSNDGTATQDNGMFQGLVGKLTGALQNNGMNAAEAQTEASNIAPDVLDSIKEKFLSSNAEDSGFDISKIAGLIGGDTGDLLGKVKGLF
ncbi:hypothetical protein [Lacinutrix sp.]|uniref:hypothetical protein n=1 Tax=Lacinutrix sp. TaxID=1937692 RepID=UPI0025C1F6B8|nr:hypothetical protein [Lacinutrix sp.]